MKKENKTKYFSVTAIALATSVLSGCASTGLDQEYEDNFQKAKSDKVKLQVKKSFLEGDSELDTSKSATAVDEQSETNTLGGFQIMEPMQRAEISFSSRNLASNFSETGKLSVSAKNMPLQDFVNYVFKDLLNQSYLLTPDVSQLNSNVTLNIANEVTPRRLFRLAQQVLSDRGISIKYNGDVYLIALEVANSKSSKVVGIGRDVTSVPEGTNNIMQIVPILYGVKVSLKSTIEQLTDVAVTLDARQGNLFLNGSREKIVRALELIRLIDSPANRGRHIGMVKLTFSTIDLYLQQMSTLLATEGIPNGISEPGNNNLVFVPLYQIGAVAVFAASQTLLDRVEYWTKNLDRPSEGDVNQYFIFHPRYARATDIGDSLMPLISGISNNSVRSNASANSADSQGPTTGQNRQVKKTTGASNDDMTFVVDERTNALVFYTTGTKYKGLLPLIHSLDVLPKQVMLQITIAEVTLTDEFKFGVDFALVDGKFEFSSNFGADDIGGGVLNWASGSNKATAQAFKSNKLVNVLSNPSILVRDGVSANIQIGTDIPVVGSTTTDPTTGTTRSVDYRKTGVTVNVTPTINAQGVVIMNIAQTNSNEVDGGTAVEGNPQIFERSILTEVVAESGQTIIMGGLVSENVTDNDSGLPGLRSIPVLGGLFGTTTKEKVKTELVIMVTPRVISRTDQWENLINTFKNNIDSIKID